ncbi:MAG: nucleoside-diphosphate sugar epimerase/dehydratase [Zhengella sp.]|uniref:polysaccharide biosynthesis protein n=1 Tax=Zhengella sp. TaxID=2282762 RepID=UPI001DEC2D2E|nr:polysaccharide biosynthesis protein [Notoacmeibacter sp.]MCC0026264.1 polysaccharide biosynthesis protein [Brucellaceae bacterium]
MKADARMLRTAVVLHDAVVLAAAFVCAHLVAFGLEPLSHVPGFGEKTAGFVALGVGSLYVMKVNRGLWRYASIPDMVAIVKATTIAVAIFTIANFMLSRGENISRVAVMLTWVFTVFGLGAGRMLYRFIKETRFFSFLRDAGEIAEHYLLYPFSDTTESYLRAIRRLNPPGFRIAGIIDPRMSFVRNGMHSLNVLGTPEHIASIVAENHARGIVINGLIVTDSTISGTEMADLLEACNDAGIGISRLPDMMDFPKAGSSNLLSPKPVRLEDLLGRQQVQVENRDISGFLKNNTVLVTGAGGSIGSELCRQIAAFKPAKLVFLDSGERNLYDISQEFASHFPETAIAPVIADIRDRSRIDEVVNFFAPDVVFHAAALKHVPIVEANPLEAVKTNILGTANVAESAVAAGAKAFVLISTDKAVNPSSVMGASKRAAELYCQALDLDDAPTCFRIVRFGNVLGSAGSVVPLFQKQIAQGGPVTVTDPEMTRYFMTIPEAVHLILQAASHGMNGAKLPPETRGAILMLNMGQPIKISDLARRLIQLAGFRPDVDVKIEYTGRRPGEKLEEELLSRLEDQIVQKHDSFIVARTRTVERGTIVNWLQELKQICRREDPEAAILLLRKIVTSYKPWTAAAADIEQISE